MQEGKLKYSFSLLLAFLLWVFFLFNGLQAKAESPTLELRVDDWYRSRVFINGIKAIVSLAGFFEFYERNLDGSRRRIYSGPWTGKLEEHRQGFYSLKGNDPATGATHHLQFKQVGRDLIEINLKIKAPGQPSHFSLDLLKLYGDLFKGTIIEATPRERNVPATIPVQPLPLERRIIMQGKSRFHLKGGFCDLEIEDHGPSANLLIADGRNVPWDRDKSIYIGSGFNDLTPHGDYLFRYTIRFLPPSGSLNFPSTVSLPLESPGVSPLLFFDIPAKEERREEGCYELRQGDRLHGRPNGKAEDILRREIERVTGWQLECLSAESVDKEKGRGIFIERIEEKRSLLEDGFEIVVSRDAIVIRGTNERACIYGAYAILNRLKRAKEAWIVPCGTIKDWPDLPVRGVCIELLRPPIRQVDLMKRYLEAVLKGRGNVVIFLHDPRQIRAWKRGKDEGYWTREQMIEVTNYARSLHLEVWGGMGSGFKPEDFPELEIRKGSTLYHPLKEQSYEYLFSLYEEILKTYPYATFLVGQDEIQGLSDYSAESGIPTSELFATNVNKIHTWLQRRGIRTAIWGDMLLDHTKWEKEVGAANSRNPFFRSGATHEALPKLPKDLIILDWHYDEKEQYRSIDYFKKHGFTVIGCPWYHPRATRSFAKSLKQFGGQGLMTMGFGLFSTLSPSATTLYGSLCAWKTDCHIDENDEDVLALAESMQSEVYKVRYSRQTEILLNRTSFASSGTGIFGKGPVFDLQAFPRGRQVFGDIPFDVLKEDGDHRPQAIVVSNSHRREKGISSSASVFQGRLTARAIAFLHTSLIEEPQYRLRPIGKYVVRYASGKREEIFLLENFNITDIRSSEGLRKNDWTFSRKPDVMIGAKTGWRGKSPLGVPLNVQVFVWENPSPEEEITTISLSTLPTPSNTAIALLGVTVLE